MRLPIRPSSALFSTSILVLAATAACGDFAAPLIAEQGVGSKEAALNAQRGSARRHFQAQRESRRHRRSRRGERLEALMADAREHGHRAAPHAEEHPPLPEDEAAGDEQPGIIDAGMSPPVSDEGETDSDPGDDGDPYEAGGSGGAGAVGSAPDAGSTGSGSGGSDAGGTSSGGTGSGGTGSGGTGGGSPQVPPGLPRDIVARSALPIYALEGDVRLSEEELWRRIAASPATCFGEDHTTPEHHYAQTRGQAELVARSAAAGRAVAFGFEMFERQFQASVDAFASGATSEEQLLADTQYLLRWGYDYSLYRPLVERGRDFGVTMLGLNARREIVRKIARTGLASLDAAEQAEMPELVLDDPEHRTFIFGLFGVLPEHAAEFGLENVYVAQTTWDEAMADTAAAWLSSSSPDSRVLVHAGNVHCHQSAIPRRITRRTSLPALSLISVLESDLELVNTEGYDLRVVIDDSPDATQ